MAEKVQFELVSPARILVSEPVDMVVVPGTEGDFGVLPGHAPLISTVRPGVIAVYQSGIVTERLFVAGGFAEVANDRVTVLAEDALPVASISRAAAEAERAEWEAKLPALRSSASEADKPLLLAAERALAAAVAKIDAAGAAGTH